MLLIPRDSIQFISFAFLAFSANFVFAESNHFGALDLSAVTVVDMTYPYNEKTIYWPTSPSSFELTELDHGHTDGGYFYASNLFCSPEHGGTHFDAPIHFAKDGLTSDRIPIQQFMGPLVVIDIREKAAANSDYRLQVGDILRWEKEYGKIPAKAIVVLNTGWGKRWPNLKRYLGSNKRGDASNLHFPAYGKTSAEFLIKQREIKVIGVDTASIDYGPSKDFIVHRIAAAANVVGLENVANIDQLPSVGAWIIALPMKISNGTGGPIRIVGLIPKQATE